MNFFKKLSRCGKETYSQCGEDRIVKHILYALGIQKISYLDIGAHDPCRLSNTYLFYKEGSSGVLIEPDPDLYKRLVRKRKRDICLNVGVCSTGTEESKEFFIMSSSTLNTFNKDEAERIQRETKCLIKKTVEIPLIGINDVLKKYFANGIHFLSLDVEAMDLSIIKAIDFAVFRPVIICVETITYSEGRKGEKIPEIAEVLSANNYFTYGDTFINTIFVDKTKWDG